MNDMDMGRGGTEMDEIQHRTHKPRHTKMMDRDVFFFLKKNKYPSTKFRFYSTSLVYL